MNFSQIADLIILISAVCLAVTRIYDFFAKPTAKFKKKAEEQEKKRVKVIIEEEMPQLFLDHDLETRQKYLGDRQNYLEEIKGEVLKAVQEDIEEIKQLNLEQNQKIETLARSSKDVLREKIMALYHKGKKTRTLALYEKEALDQYYKDYKAEDGNSYIDKYYKRMCSWDIIDSDEEYED